MDFFATAAKGTEPALRDELRELRLRRVRADRGGVHFGGELTDGFRVCLWSRIAMRVLLLLGEFEARDAAELYAGVRALPWAPFLTPAHTLIVAATSKDSALTHTQFIAQKTKDAVVDQIRLATGARPSVALEDADVRIQVHLARDRAQVYVDLSGEALHRRGYRRDMSVAPLKENLAAAILRIAGWDRARPLMDPMCGSGTFAIEAALWARNIAPGLARKRFGFERWASHDAAFAEAFASMREHAQEHVLPSAPEIVASDMDEAAVAATRANARAAGVSVTILRRSIEAIGSLRPPALVVTNPPYGERLAGDAGLYRTMAEAFARLHGHTVVLLSGTPAIERAMRVLPDGTHTLFNGPIECRLLRYEIP